MVAFECGRGYVTRTADKLPLLVFADDWGRHPSSCQHLIRHMLDRQDVWWVNTIGMRTPRFDRATLTRGERWVPCFESCD